MSNAQPKYVVVIKDITGANSYEFAGISDIAWEWYENEVGRCVFKIPHNDLNLSATSVSATAFSEIIIYRNGSLVWQGFIAYLLDNVDSTTVYGLTYLEILKWYRVGYNTAYTTKKIGSEFISPIYDIIAAYTGNFLSAKITKGTIENPYTTGTTTQKTVTKTVFDEDFFTILQDMVGVSRADSPSGAWKQDTVFNISFSETAPTFSFLRDVGTNKADVIYELDSEIVDFSYGTDFRFIRNDVKGFGIQSGPLVLTSPQADATSRSSFYLRQYSPYFGSVTDQTQLDEMSKDILKDFKDPTRNFSITLAAGLSPFDGYVMGDGIKVRINRGRISLDEYFRVTGMEVSLANKGVEMVRPILQRQRT